MPARITEATLELITGEEFPAIQANWNGDPKYGPVEGEVIYLSHRWMEHGLGAEERLVAVGRFEVVNLDNGDVRFKQVEGGA